MQHRHEEYMPTAMTRRRFLWVSTMTTAGVITGCAVNPVTGKKQLMLMSEEQEVEVDLTNSPHQFSADYGPTQDAALNQYLTEVGKGITSISHRPNMPYTFRAVNATYVNAYAFPGGSIAATRGILLSLESEAELAALLGHEIGHVNARHTAERMTKGTLLQALLGIGTIAVAQANEKLAPWVAQLGSIGAGALLAHYSRDDERQADDLGMMYMTKAGYTPQGMVDLMDLLNSLSRSQPNALEMMFSTHPMSSERYQTAVNSAKTTYASAASLPFQKERYMDHTAALRKMKNAIDAMNAAESEMANEKYAAAEPLYKKALTLAPQDYAGLVMMAKCQIALQKPAEAEKYTTAASQVYPQEAQAYHVAGIAGLVSKKFDKAYERFAKYDTLLPGNPTMAFFKGYSLEGMQRKADAANEYIRFLNSVQEGEEAEYAYGRLVEWGYVKQQQQQQQLQQQMP